MPRICAQLIIFAFLNHWLPKAPTASQLTYSIKTTLPLNAHFLTSNFPIETYSCKGLESFPYIISKRHSFSESFFPFLIFFFNFLALEGKRSLHFYMWCWTVLL